MARTGQVYEIDNQYGNKGRALIAKIDLQRGDIIMSERPLLEFNDGSCSRGRHYEAQAAQQARAAYLRMSPVEKRCFNKLLPAKTTETVQEDLAYRRVLQNGFTADTDSRGKTIRIYKDISLANHSCLPNAVVNYNKSIEQGTMFCCQAISAGQEIVIDYLPLNTFRPRAERQEDLQSIWHFYCECRACVQPRGRGARAAFEQDEMFRLHIMRTFQRLGLTDKRAWSIGTRCLPRTIEIWRTWAICKAVRRCS